jgi:hypothetical protein
MAVLSAVLCMLRAVCCVLPGWFSSCVPDAEDTRDGVKLVIKVCRDEGVCVWVGGSLCGNPLTPERLPDLRRGDRGVGVLSLFITSDKYMLTCAGASGNMWF